MKRQIAGLFLNSLVVIGAVGCVVLPSVQAQWAEREIAATVGNPLAKELQDKPVLVDVYASWCPGCKNIASTLSTLQEEYKGKIHVVVLDVTDKSTTEKSADLAKKLGLSSFFEANKSKTSTVAIIDPKTGQIVRQFQNNPEKADYVTGIAEAETRLAQ